MTLVTLMAADTTDQVVLHLCQAEPLAQFVKYQHQEPPGPLRIAGKLLPLK